MIVASSSTVLANLAYLIGAVVVAVIGGLLVWLHHRQPKSVDANMASFRRGLNALAPEPGSPGGPGRRAEEGRVRAVPAGLTHVRLDTRVATEPYPEDPGLDHADYSGDADYSDDDSSGDAGYDDYRGDESGVADQGGTQYAEGQEGGRTG